MFLPSGVLALLPASPLVDDDAGLENGDDGGGGGGDYYDLDHLYRVYVPSSLLVLATWGSFLVPPEMLPARLILLVSAVCSSSPSNLSSTHH